MISLFEDEEAGKKVLYLKLCIQGTETCVQPVPYRFSVPVRQFLVVRKSNVSPAGVGKKKEMRKRSVAVKEGGGDSSSGRVYRLD